MDQWCDGQVVVVVGSFVFDGCSRLEGGVASLRVVEDLEVFEDGVGQLDSVRHPLPVVEFGLYAGPERLHYRVIEAVPDWSHRR